LRASLLLLADSRLPAGGHAHSGGLEAASALGDVGDIDGLAGFLRGRLATAGLVAAAFAAASCQHAAEVSGAPPGLGGAARWAELDHEVSVRTPSPAQRAAGRAQGRSLLRAGRATWPHPGLDNLAASIPGPYHPVALGACVLAAGGTPGDAAVIAASLSLTGPASAAIRLLGLDPLAVSGLLARLAADADAVASEAARAAASADWASLPAHGSPALDLLAELHLAAEARLFES
jgi:urease accessory protein